MGKCASTSLVVDERGLYESYGIFLAISEQETFPNGFTTLSNDNPTSMNGFRSKRKQTLLSLLDMLNELTREGELGDHGE